MSCKNLNSGQNDKNFRRMDCEFDLDNDATSNQNERNFFKTFGFSYYIFYEGESSTAGGSGSSGVGTVGTSSQYAASKQNSAYYYQVISCGASFVWDGKSQNATLKQIQSLQSFKQVFGFYSFDFFQNMSLLGFLNFLLFQCKLFLL